MKNQLIADVGCTLYSLIIDESTDITTNKQLCIVIRYYSEVKKWMISTFLGLVILEETSANAQERHLSNLKKSFYERLLFCNSDTY